MPHVMIPSRYASNLGDLRRARLRSLIHGWAARARAPFGVWRERSFNREYLRTASDIELRDMGMSRFEAQREAAKGFWQP